MGFGENPRAAMAAALLALTTLAGSCDKPAADVDASAVPTARGAELVEDLRVEGQELVDEANGPGEGRMYGFGGVAAHQVGEFYGAYGDAAQELQAMGDYAGLAALDTEVQAVYAQLVDYPEGQESMVNLDLAMAAGQAFLDELAGIEKKDVTYGIPQLTTAAKQKYIEFEVACLRAGESVDPIRDDIYSRVPEHLRGEVESGRSAAMDEARKVLFGGGAE